MSRILAIVPVAALTALGVTSVAYAADFQPMVRIPGIDTGRSYTMVELVNSLYVFLIAIGAIIGVIKIAFAGVKWATSVSGSSISAAKEDIKGVLLGLLILSLPYLVLSAINPNFVKLDVLNLKSLDLPQTETEPSPTPPGGVNTSTLTDQKESGNQKCSYCLFHRLRTATSQYGTCKNFVTACSASGGQITETVVDAAVDEAGTKEIGLSCWAPADQCSQMPTSINNL